MVVVGGAAARLAVGYWSARSGSRLRPLRVLTVGIGAIMLGLALGTLSGSGVATVALLVAAVLTVTPNGPPSPPSRSTPGGPGPGTHWACRTPQNASARPLRR